MYAVVRTGGKQYKVETGSVVDVETLPGEAGDAITLEDVLLVGEGDEVRVGQPLVQGAAVKAKIIQHKRGPKLVIFKKIRRKGKQLKKGHRQELTRIRIEEITVA